MSYRNTLIQSARAMGAKDYAGRIENMPSLIGRRTVVAALSISVVKSLGVLEISRLKIARGGLQTPNGLFADRSAMIIWRKQSRVGNEVLEWGRLSQREKQGYALARAKPELIDGGTKLVYRNGAVHNLIITPEMLAPRRGRWVRCRLSSKSEEIIGGVLEGDDGPITTWVRELLHHDRTLDLNSVHVLLRHADTRRKVCAMHACGEDAETLFSDGGEVSVAAVSDLVHLNGSMRLKNPNSRQIQKRAFRMNAWLGDDLPTYALELIASVVVRNDSGAHVLKFGGNCVRCPVTNLIPDVGVKPSDNEPLVTLASSKPPRSEDGAKPTFGVNAVFAEEAHGGYIEVNDEVEVLSEKV